jgi:VanW like protein
VAVDAIAGASYRRPLVGRGSQAIPMGVYRRQQLTAQVGPRLVVLLAAVALYMSGVSPWALNSQRGADRPTIRDILSGPILASRSTTDAQSGTASPGDSTRMLGPSEVAHGMAYVGGMGEAAVTNAAIAISFLDGTVIEPGEQLSFDDVARTWDFNEDPIYVWGTATTTRGIIPMRGGGVCWVSTALWRATLAAGLRTDFRENHYGLVDQLGAGLDATNTLVIRNDSPVPITVRALLDEDEVHVSLLADGPLDRTAEVDGPFPAGRGGHVIYQDVTWADGRTTSSQFVSRYYW